MKIYQNLTIIGTSHVARQSINEVKEVISSRIPKVVALELDKHRLMALLQKNMTNKLSLRDARMIGIKGYLFGKLGQWIGNKVGKLVGVKPGTEMITAYKIAQSFNCHVALIDQEIGITLKKLSKELTWKEKFRFLADIVKGVFKKNTIKFDLHRVPDNKLIKVLLSQVKDRYPNVYKVIVEDRNKFMAKRLYRLMQEYDDVVAVVGAGHTDEIINEIKCLQKKR